MSRILRAACVTLIAACGKLPTSSDGVAFLQIEQPSNRTIAVGGTLQLHALALDRAGNPLDVPVLWRTPDTTITVGASTGLVTGVAPDSGRVQAVIGEDKVLISDFITIQVKAAEAAPRRP